MSEKLNKTSIINYLKKHTLEFKEKYHVEKMGLFGSYAKGNATKDSDIDIFVKIHPSFFKEKDFNKKVDITREHKNLKPYNQTPFFT